MKVKKFIGGTYTTIDLDYVEVERYRNFILYDVYEIKTNKKLYRVALSDNDIKKIIENGYKIVEEVYSDRGLE